MLMVSSTDGSSISTGWKRRSRAASFSMYLRYSSSVVCADGGSRRQQRRAYCRRPVILGRARADHGVARR